MRRVKMEGGVYHCMSRVVAGDYLLGEREKAVLCKQLWQVAEFCGVEILTYCIMSNHFHVLVRIPERVELSDVELLKRAEVLYFRDDDCLQVIRNVFANGDKEAIERVKEKLYARMYDVSGFMKELKQRFSIWYNKNHGRYGVFWADRFKSVLVEGKRFAVEMVAAYIDLNPVRAGIVNDPKDYRYSGYGEAMSGIDRSRKGLMKAVYEEDDWKGALTSYRQVLFGKGAVARKEGQGSIDDELAQNVLDKNGKLSKTELLYCRIRYFSNSVILGSKEFVRECYDSRKEYFDSQRRESKPKELIGGDWGKLRVLRGLRNVHGEC